MVICVPKPQHPDMDALKETLSRAPMKDNVIDWPLDFAIRTGFDPDKMIGRALNRVAGFGNQVKNKWNYIVNYEAYLKAQDVESRMAEKQVLRKSAHEVASYLDEVSALKRTIAEFDKEAKKQGVDKSVLPGFEKVYQRSLARDKQAYQMMTEQGSQLDKLTNMKDAMASIKHYSERYERYSAVESIARLEANEMPTERLIKEVAKVDLKKDYVHVVRLAALHKKTPSAVYQQIEGAQKSHRQMMFNQLKQEHPVLVDYDKLFKERSTAVGFKAEQLDKALLTKAREVIANKDLSEKLQRDLPKFAKSLVVRMKKHGVDKGIAL